MYLIWNKKATSEVISSHCVKVVRSCIIYLQHTLALLQFTGCSASHGSMHLSGWIIGWVVQGWDMGGLRVGQGCIFTFCCLTKDFRGDIANFDHYMALCNIMSKKLIKKCCKNVGCKKVNWIAAWDKIGHMVFMMWACHLEQWQVTSISSHKWLGIPARNTPVYIRGYSITRWTRWGGGRGSKNVCFCPHSGYENCPRRGGGHKWQNSVHVVVECQLRENWISSCDAKTHKS